MTEDLAVSYARFSIIGQASGDSENRQWLMFLSFCDRHKLRPAKQSFIDRGLSGWSGKHLKGELGRLRELAKRHHFPRGTTLVIEAWDRLGRLRPDKQIDLISSLLKAGLRIGVCRLDDVFELKDFGTHKWVTLSVFVQLAYDESLQKSERLSHSWKSRKQRARENGKLATTLGPAWLQVINGKMVPIPDRVAIVNRIFHLAGSGHGRQRIAHLLNSEGIKPFGRGKGGAKLTSGGSSTMKPSSARTNPCAWSSKPMARESASPMAVP